MDEINEKSNSARHQVGDNSLNNFYRDTLDERDITILKSLKDETRFVEGNFYADNLRKMGFHIISESIDISLSSEELNYYSSDYIIIERDGLFGLASLNSSRIYIQCDFNKITKDNDFKFNAFVLYKDTYIYIYNYDKDVIISKMEAQEIKSVMAGNNIIIKNNEKIGIYNILSNKYVLNCEYEDVLYYDDRVIALLKNNIITIFNYINSKVLLEYKFSSNEYYMESKDLSVENIFVINKENKLGLLNIFTGEFLVVPEYDCVELVECYGKKTMVILKKEGKYGLYNIDRKEFILQCICNEIIVPSNSLRKYIFIYTVEGYKGVASDKGVLTNYIFNEIDVCSKGSYFICKTNKNFYVYSNGKCIFTFDNNSKFEVLNLESKRGIFKGTKFIDKDIICIDFNNRCIDGCLKYYSIEYTLEEDEGYIIKSSNNHYYILNTKNDNIYDNIIKNKYYRKVKKLSKHFVCYKGDKCALADNYGNLITSIKYDNIYENDEGLIILELNNYLGCFYSGKVTKCIYDNLNIFSNKQDEYIIANKEGKVGLLLEGKVLIPFDYEEIFIIDEGNRKEICNIFNINNKYEKIKYIVRKSGKYGVCSEKGFVMSEFLMLEGEVLHKIILH